VAKKTITISQELFNEHVALPCPDVERFDVGTPRMQAVMEPAIQAMEKVLQVLKKGTAKDAQVVINFLSLWQNYVRYGASTKTVLRLDTWKLAALPKVEAWWAEKHAMQAPLAKAPAKKAAARKVPRGKKTAKRK
jgi:hypothetical protein